MAYQLFQLPKAVPVASGIIVPGAKLSFFLTTTTTPTPVYTTSALSVAITQPVVADAAGIFQAIYLDPAITYKATLTDSVGSLLYTIDPVNDSILTSASILAILTQSVVGAILYPLTAYEISTSASVANYFYPPYWVPRYGNNTTPLTTNCAPIIQTAINAAAAAKTYAYLPGWFDEALISSTLTITASRSGLVGDGKGKSRIFVSGAIDGITVSAGLSFVHLNNMSIAKDVRYTTAVPNTSTAIRINGTTASSVTYSELNNLFIDGFETAIKPDGLRDSEIDSLTAVFCKNGVISSQLTSSVHLTNFDISGGDIANNFFASSVAIRIGDGTAAAEGWFVGPGVTYRHATGFDALASSNHEVHNVIHDQVTQFGVLLRSSTASCSGCSFNSVFAYMTGAAADSGFYLTNSVALSAGSDFGHSFSNCKVGQYAGTTLTNGFLCDGTQETNHRIEGGYFSGDTFDIRIATGTNWIVTGVRAPGPGFSFAVGVNPRFDNCTGTVSGIIPDVASAAAITLPVGPKVFTISGTTSITSIVATGHTGETVTLIFAGALTFTDGSNLKLNGNFVTTADDTITLVCDGTNYFELCRSAN